MPSAANGRTATSGVAGKIGLAVASILATLLALEAAMRVGAHLENRGLLSALPASGAPAPGSRVTLGQMIRRSPNARIVYELRPRLRVLYEGGRVTTNAHGFRGRELAVDKPAGALRIVGLGDSYMFGQGVSDEETYLAIVEASLGGRPAAPREPQVINTAVPGYNTVMEVETLEAKGMAWRPDLVVLEVTGNDVDLPNFIRTPEDPGAGGRSFLAELVARRLGRLRTPARHPEGLEPAPEEELHGSQRFLADPSRVPPEYRGLVGLDAWEKALRKLHEAGARSGVPVVVLTQGVSFDRRLWRLCRDLGFHYLDVAPAIRRYLRAGGYREYVLSPLVIRQGDSHPSRIGHEIIARELLTFLAERDLLGAGPARPPG